MATEVKTTVPGNIWKVLVKEGDIVKSEKGTSKVTQIRKHEKPTKVYSI